MQRIGTCEQYRISKIDLEKVENKAVERAAFSMRDFDVQFEADQLALNGNHRARRALLEEHWKATVASTTKKRPAAQTILRRCHRPTIWETLLSMVDKDKVPNDEAAETKNETT